jgi:hypothetical protein
MREISVRFALVALFAGPAVAGLAFVEDVVVATVVDAVVSEVAVGARPPFVSPPPSASSLHQSKNYKLMIFKSHLKKSNKIVDQKLPFIAMTLPYLLLRPIEFKFNQ